MISPEFVADASGGLWWLDLAWIWSNSLNSPTCQLELMKQLYQKRTLSSNFTIFSASLAGTCKVKARFSISESLIMALDCLLASLSLAVSAACCWAPWNWYEHSFGLFLILQTPQGYFRSHFRLQNQHEIKWIESTYFSLLHGSHESCGLSLRRFAGISGNIFLW